MNFFKKLDRSSKVLVSLSLLGILISIIGLYTFSHLISEDKSLGAPIAKVVLFQNDARVKRSDNLHWYPVKQALDCYADDLVFTGNESTAIVEFPHGDKISLLPNSLISLSKNRISLESGSLEVDLKGGDPIVIESFGETFTVKEKTKFRLVSEGKVKRIIPLEKNLNPLKHLPQLQKLIQTDEITLLNPSPGKYLPLIPEHFIRLEWKGQAKKTYQVALSQEKSFDSPFLTLESDQGSVDVPLKGAPQGLIFWKVFSLGKSKQSTFYLAKDYVPELLSPINRSTVDFNQAQEGLWFEWTKSLDSPHRFQVSKDPMFQTPILDQVLDDSKFKLRLEKEGTYFWRIGLNTPHHPTYFFPSATFLLKKAVVPSPITIHGLPKLLDFSLNKSYRLDVNDPNHCEELEFEITQEELIISQFSTRQPKIHLKKLSDGMYTIKVTGKIKGTPIMTSEPLLFEVKSSPALKAPQIRRKKVKLFVKILKQLFHLVINEAQALDNSLVLLKWESGPDAQYEIEISQGAQEKVILTKLIPNPEFIFKVPEPGLYYWRVRSKKKGQWSPFSEYAEIHAEDKISLVNSPLMEAPIPYSDFLVEKNKKNAITFKWKEPFKDLAYYLEIYTNEEGPPLKVIPVQKGSLTLKFRNRPARFWWRVLAKSPYGNTLSNQEKYEITLSDVLEKPAPLSPQIEASKKNKAFLRLQVAQTSSQYEQKVDDSTLSDDVDKNVSLNGQTFFLSSEFWPKTWKRSALNFGIKYSTLAQGQNSLKESDFIGEFGRKIQETSLSQHILFLGARYNVVDISYEDSTSSSYVMGYGSLRYNYLRRLSEKMSLEMNAELLNLIDLKLVTPSIRLRPALNYRLSTKLWGNVFTGLERNIGEPSYDEGGLSGNLNTSSQIFMLGLGLTLSL